MQLLYLSSLSCNHPNLLNLPNKTTSRFPRFCHASGEARATTETLMHFTPPQADTLSLSGLCMILDTRLLKQPMSRSIFTFY
jgi:hypothetical protein